jgi:hypothetical protein
MNARRDEADTLQHPPAAIGIPRIRGRGHARHLAIAPGPSSTPRIRQSYSAPALNTRPLVTPTPRASAYPGDEDNHAAANTISPQNNLPSPRPDLTIPSYTAGHHPPYTLLLPQTPRPPHVPSIQRHREKDPTPDCPPHTFTITQAPSDPVHHLSSLHLQRTPPADSPNLLPSRPYTITLTNRIHIHHVSLHCHS